MNMTKEEKIKEAWGKYLPKLEENGWLYFGYACNGWDDVEDWLNNFGAICDRSYYDMTYAECDNGDLVNVEIRPKSLQGIEDNNGWIQLTGEPSEIEWIPNLELYNIETKEHYLCTDENEFIEIGRFTHYKPIVLSEPPIY